MEHQQPELYCALTDEAGSPGGTECFEKEMLLKLRGQHSLLQAPWREQQHAYQQPDKELQIEKAVPAAAAGIDLSSAGTGEPPAFPLSHSRATMTVITAVEQHDWPEYRQQQTEDAALQQDLQQRRFTLGSQDEQKPQPVGSHVQAGAQHQWELHCGPKELPQAVAQSQPQESQQTLPARQWQQTPAQRLKQQQLCQQRQSEHHHQQSQHQHQQSHHQHQQNAPGQDCSPESPPDELLLAVPHREPSSRPTHAAESGEEIDLLSAAEPGVPPTEDDKLRSMRCPWASDDSSRRSSSFMKREARGIAARETLLSPEKADSHCCLDRNCGCANEHSIDGDGRRGDSLTSGLCEANVATSSTQATVCSSSSSGARARSREAMRSSRSYAGLTNTSANCLYPGGSLSRSTSSVPTSPASSQPEIPAGRGDAGTLRRSGRGETSGQQSETSVGMICGEVHCSRIRSSASRRFARGCTSSNSPSQGSGGERITGRRKAVCTVGSREAACDTRGSRRRRGNSNAGEGTSTESSNNANRTRCRSRTDSAGGGHCRERSSSRRSGNSRRPTSSFSSVDKDDINSVVHCSRIRSSTLSSDDAGEGLELLVCSNSGGSRRRSSSSNTRRGLGRGTGKDRNRRERRGGEESIYRGSKRSSGDRKGGSGEGRSESSNTESDNCTDQRGGLSSRGRRATVMRHFDMLVDSLAAADQRDAVASPVPEAKTSCLPWPVNPPRRRQQREQPRHREKQQLQPAPHREHRRNPAGLPQKYPDALQGRPLSRRGASCVSQDEFRSDTVVVHVLDGHARESSAPLEVGRGGRSRVPASRSSSITSTSHDSSAARRAHRYKNGISERTSSSSDDPAGSGSLSFVSGRDRSRNISEDDFTCGRHRRRRGSCAEAGDTPSAVGSCMHDEESCRIVIGEYGGGYTGTQRSEGCSSGECSDSSKYLCESEGSTIRSHRRGSKCMLQGKERPRNSCRSTISSEGSTEPSRAAGRPPTADTRKFASSSLDLNSPRSPSGLHSSGSGQHNLQGIRQPISGCTGVAGAAGSRKSSSSNSCAETPQQRQQWHQSGREEHRRTVSKGDSHHNLSRLKCWAMETFDVLPDAWVVKRIHEVATRGEGCSPTSLSTSSSITAHLGSLPADVTVTRKETAVASSASKAPKPATTACADDGAAGEDTAENAAGIAEAASRRALPAARSLGLFTAQTVNATHSAAAGTAVAAATVPAAEATETLSETVGLLQEYARRDTAAAAAAAKKARQESAKSVIRQQLLQQYSSVLQQLQQHKAAAQLVQNESEPLRAALVRVVAAESKLKKLQYSERWRLHVGSLIHDSDKDLVEYMAYFGTPADELSVSMERTDAGVTRSRKGRRTLRLSSTEEPAAEGTEEDYEENEEDSHKEGTAQGGDERVSFTVRALMLIPSVSLLLRRPARTMKETWKTKKGGISNKTARRREGRSHARLLLKWFAGYVLLCAAVYLWLRHTIHQL